MADIPLGRLLKEAGYDREQVLEGIEPTQAQERELLALIALVVARWRSLRRGRIRDAYMAASRVVSKAPIEIALSEAYQDVERTITGIIPDLTDWMNRMERWHRRRWSASVQGVVRLDISPFMRRADVAPVLEAAIERNIALTRGLSDDIRKRLERATWDAWAEGRSTTRLARALREEMDFAPARARLIARDQLGKVSADLDRIRHTQAGVKRFVWKTSGDERVRPKHVALGGKTFTYARPPSEGLPGQPINCRCKARPVIEPE